MDGCMDELVYETPKQRSDRLKLEAKEKKKALAKAEKGLKNLNAIKEREEEKELKFSKLKRLLKKGSELVKSDN